MVQYRKIVKAGIAQWVKDLQARNIKMQIVQNLDRLIELDISFRRMSCNNANTIESDLCLFSQDEVNSPIFLVNCTINYFD